MTPVNLEENTAGASEAPGELTYRWANRTPEQKLADREEAMKWIRPGRPLPPGKMFFEVVQGTWPGDETDEEVNRALEELS